jgi:hypothetical protein
MKEIQIRELQRVIRFLEGIDCQYAIITDDNELFSNGLEVKQRKSRSPLAFPYGEVKSFIQPQINLAADIGSVQEINVGKYGAERVRSGVCSILSSQWGKETYTTSLSEHTVEVLRIS